VGLLVEAVVGVVVWVSNTTLIWNQRQLERLVADYTDHYNQHRPHRSLDQQPPASGVAQQHNQPLRIVKSTRCDGLINEYRNAA